MAPCTKKQQTKPGGLNPPAGLSPSLGVNLIFTFRPLRIDSYHRWYACNSSGFNRVAFKARCPGFNRVAFNAGWCLGFGALRAGGGPGGCGEIPREGEGRGGVRGPAGAIGGGGGGGGIRAPCLHSRATTARRHCLLAADDAAERRHTHLLAGRGRRGIRASDRGGARVTALRYPQRRRSICVWTSSRRRRFGRRRRLRRRKSL